MLNQWHHLYILLSFRYITKFSHKLVCCSVKFTNLRILQLMQMCARMHRVVFWVSDNRWISEQISFCHFGQLVALVFNSFQCNLVIFTWPTFWKLIYGNLRCFNRKLLMLKIVRFSRPPGDSLDWVPKFPSSEVPKFRRRAGLPKLIWESPSAPELGNFGAWELRNSV